MAQINGNGNARVSFAGELGEMSSSIDRMFSQNKMWAEEKVKDDPDYFERLCHLQTPEFLWIGCADSRVPANVLAGLAPGEVFTQRNVGNQAMHTDLNCQTCIEYGVSVLKVKTVVVCGHYNCGAVAAALKMPSKTPGLVNCWISDIRECRNQHWGELKGMAEEEQLRRLCEYNVLRQTFHVCTSPAVQAAWDRGQEINVTRNPDTFMMKVMTELMQTSQALNRSRRSTGTGGQDEIDSDSIAHVTNTQLRQQRQQWQQRPRLSSHNSPNGLHRAPSGSAAGTAAATAAPKAGKP
eukprot:gene4957-34736_t